MQIYKAAMIDKVHFYIDNHFSS